MSTEVQIPQIGESVQTVFIARWLKKVGEAVKAGEGIVELDSDKATMEVPAPADGVLEEQLAEEGDEVEVGSVIARLDENGVAAEEKPAAKPKEEAKPPAKPPAKPTAKPKEEAKGGAAAGAEEPAKPRGDVRAGPAARQSAREGGVDLDAVEGSGRRGRVTRQDVERAAKARGEEEEPPAKSARGRVERVPMSPLRRTIARRLVEAQQNAAMLTTFNEVDMSAVMELRKRYQEQFVARYGIKLGFMSFFLKACVSALLEFPAVNAEVDGHDILYKSYYNIGVAVSGPKGLVVPVVRDADRLSFAETEQAIAELGAKAKANKLQLSDFEDGTFTVSNGGIFGSMMSTPILNPPQSGILGMHNIVKRAVVVDDQVTVRPMMYLALSYDHRIIDGREAVSFLVRVKQLIEDPERILIEA